MTSIKPTSTSYFKRTWCGQVLMVLQWKTIDEKRFYYFRKATEQETAALSLNIVIEEK